MDITQRQRKKELPDRHAQSAFCILQDGIENSLLGPVRKNCSFTGVQNNKRYICRKIGELL